MDRKGIIESAVEFSQSSPLNYVSAEAAIAPEYVGMKMFEAPIFAFGKADDEIYAGFKAPEAIGAHHLTPPEMLAGAKTVISYFLPYTERIKTANSLDAEWPANEWLHGRIEGQLLVTALSSHIKDLLLGEGHESIVPFIDKKYRSGHEGNIFTSNWSERHVAYACGLGTFGLSKGLITEKGTCGRFGSILTELDLPCDSRNYSGLYEYCIMCGICITRCPVHDISFEKGKEFAPCNEFLGKVMNKHKPRYGCGKCQVSVPCESERP